ncbi:siderophore-interacting protein [Tomitella fengzijianii]|uniref:Siderophore-interacting protein n=1 Tax=Tomitella fengzijianii TaxID=2597660 RepID=A0A516X5T7_9ACTN|nr:siderophore-interacting protein [Tomitella fengzijianii]QDQ98435.1 siderophore-interacting protein [Tomitella fengzijianii]
MAHSTTASDTRLAARPVAGEHRIIPVSVTANESLAENVRRLTFTAPAFADYRLTGPDEYFGLLMPRDGREFRWFDPDAAANIRAAVTALAPEEQPELRWYTIRSLDPVAATIDVDVVTHGDDGPGSRWVLRAAPGDTAGVYTSSGIWWRPDAHRLLVADATAVPALRSVLEFLAAHHPGELQSTHVLALAASDAELEPGLVAQWGHRLGTLELVYAPEDRQCAETARILREWTREGHPAARVPYVWACGEADLAKAARTMAVKTWGLDVEAANWATYWIRGRARP